MFHLVLYQCDMASIPIRIPETDANAVWAEARRANRRISRAEAVREAVRDASPRREAAEAVTREVFNRALALRAGCNPDRPGGCWMALGLFHFADDEGLLGVYAVRNQRRRPTKAVCTCGREVRKPK